MTAAVVARPPKRRGGELRGNSTDRRRRHEWLVETFRADVDQRPGAATFGLREWDGVPRGEGVPACRCFRCGVLLTVDTVTADRVQLGMHGGRYTRDNLRPACSPCQTHQGNEVRWARDESGEGLVELIASVVMLLLLVGLPYVWALTR